MLPAEVQDNERIRAHLNAALNAMNAAVEGVPLRYAHPGQPAAPGQRAVRAPGTATRAQQVVCFRLTMPSF